MIRFLLILVLIAFVARAFWRVVDGILEGARSSPRAKGGELMVRDPVCGTYLPPSTALTAGHGVAIRYFCSEACRSKFRESRA